MQSTICSVPGVCATAVAWVFWGTSMYHATVSASNDALEASIESSLKPIIPPFTLFLVAYLTAFAYLPSGCNTLANWTASTRKFLYLDGALGFWPQFVMATCIALIEILPGERTQSGIALLLFVGSVLSFLVAGLWQAFVTGLRYRNEMIDYDYIPRPEMFQIFEEPSQLKITMVGGFAVLGCIAALHLAVNFTAQVLAALVHFIRGE